MNFKKQQLLKIFARIFIFLLSLTGFTASYAQYLEFIENKGQWDDRVKFTGNLNGGAIYLQQAGYKVLLNNSEDMKRIAEVYGAHLPDKASGTDNRSANIKSPHYEKDPIQGNPDRQNLKTQLRSHAYEVRFAGASKIVDIVPEKYNGTFNNYFKGNDSSKWASGCKIYQAIVYKNVYPNIDVRYYTDNNQLKYDFIVHPGGDPTKIALEFDGVSGLKLKNGNLIIQTTVSDVTELAPETYQITEKGKSVIPSKYVLIGNTVRFKINDYSKNSTLIIDPTLIFSTFTGSKADNWGYTATYDGLGNFYAGGIAFDNGFPTNNGAFQKNFQGGDNSEGAPPYDVVIIKFNPSGSNRIYATYLGGSGDEQPHSLIVDNNGDLIIAGRTTSTDFPTTVASFGPGGGFDIFITKLNPTGTALVGSRKFGGPGTDGVNIRPKYISPQGAETIRRNYGDDARSEVLIDAANNIYLASCTQDPAFPTTPGAFQPKMGGGRQDGVVIKTNSNLSTVLFSSFIGGNGDDAAFVLALHPNDNLIYVAGGTTSTNFPGVKNGTALYNSFQGGECDGYVSLITNDGNTLLKSSYFGTSGNDLVYGIEVDKFGFPYIMGTTTGAWPVVNSKFVQPNGKQFIAKLKPDLSGWEYSTVFGKGSAAPDLSPVAFLVDRCENVYVSGWGGEVDIGLGYPNANTRGLSTTPNAIQSSTDGSDFYFFVLERNAQSQLYGSYFGNAGGFGDHVDGGTSRFDRQGVIYMAMCANCNKAGTFPTTPGVWSPQNGAQQGALCNLAAVKIAFELAGVGTGVRASIEGIPRDTSGCVPLLVDFTDTIAIAKKYIWNFGDGSPDQSTLIPSNNYTYTKVGDYKVMLVAIDSSTCNIADTSYTHIRVRNDRAQLAIASQKLPPCESLSYQFTNNSTAAPGRSFADDSFLWDFGDGDSLITNSTTLIHHYKAAGTYIVKLHLLDTSFCNAPDVKIDTLRIAANVTAKFETPPSGCAPYDAVFNNVSLAGNQFFWDFGDGATSRLVNPVHTYANPGNYTVKLLAIDLSTCNQRDSISTNIVISPKPAAAFAFNPQPPLENTPINFINGSTGGTSFEWEFGDGQTLKTAKRDTVVNHIYGKTGFYKACLVTANNFGCEDTVCHEVQAIVVPLLDVPNAFTPNGDGINDVITIKGYGIEKLNWKIYNRWGTMVFQSADQSQGWDGKYKGVLQPQEVYNYVLDVEFSDGTKYQKKGDITLLR